MDNTQEKKNNGRKIAAGALGVLGVMGLGLAAATQLNLSWQGNFQAGAVTVEADCQTEAITTKFTEPKFTDTEAIPWGVDGVKFTNIDTACKGLNYEVTYRMEGVEDWTTPDKGTVAGDTISVNVDTDAQKIKEFALTIYGG